METGRPSTSPNIGLARGARVLVTGAAGFIGFHVARRLLAVGCQVLGVDNFNAYYDVGLKEARAAILQAIPGFAMARLDIADLSAFEAAWAGFAPDYVVHLAAQAGVRYSVEHPEAYVAANLVGSFHVLELARRQPVKHLLAASTSSVYGANTHMPFAETDRAAHPLTLYAATKTSTELMGHAYAHLFAIPTTFFRFFTVYGPWSRPDMAPIKFAQAIFAGNPIEVFNHGEMWRDFTFVDDLVDALVALVTLAPGTQAVGPQDSLSPAAAHRVVNIGGGRPVKLTAFIAALEAAIGKPAQRALMPMQPGDVPSTSASVALLEALIGPRPSTPLEQGVAKFVDWYRDYYRP
jgi:UDP-glucuronate 4-epimerase